MIDAHLHLQDPRLCQTKELIAAMHQSGIRHCVVNGTSPDDWLKVHSLHQQHPNLIFPSYGLHPWHAESAAAHPNWLATLENFVGQSDFPAIGECGLDRWVKGWQRELQEPIFLEQIHLATRLNARLTIHILRAWGWFLDLLRAHKTPARGFLLHSYNGSCELLGELLDRGAYFSFSGHYLHERKQTQQEALRQIPLDRLLIETDAPDMTPPAAHISYPLADQLNHPANLPRIYAALSELLKVPLPKLTEQVTANFQQFFLTKD